MWALKGTVSSGAMAVSGEPITFAAARSGHLQHTGVQTIVSTDKDYRTDAQLRLTSRLVRGA